MEATILLIRVLQLLLLAFSSAAISFTISYTSIFKGLRERVSKIHPKLEELIHCPWCLNHYVVFLMVLCCRISYILISEYWIINFFVTSFAIIAIAGLVHYVLLRAYKPVAEAMLMREMKKLEKE